MMIMIRGMLVEEDVDLENQKYDVQVEEDLEIEDHVQEEEINDKLGIQKAMYVRWEVWVCKMELLVRENYLLKIHLKSSSK